MVRKPKGGHVGRASGFLGEKLEWLESFEDEFRSGDRGDFYTAMSKRFFVRYGFDLGFEENVPGDIEDWVPANRKEGLSGEALEKENDWQEEERKKLRGKLSNWYRHRYTGKKLHSGALSSILKRMQAMTGPGARPKRTANVTRYSRLYYTTRLKEAFDEEWAKAKETLGPEKRVAHCQAFVKEAYERESEEFKKALTAELKAEYEEAKRVWKERSKIPEATAETYHEALENFDEVGIPLADALSERLGMHVMIMAVGPVRSQRGEVRLRSIFSDTSTLGISKVWGEFDRPAFTAAEASITRYGRALYGTNCQRDRAWPPLDLSGMLTMPGAGGQEAGASSGPSGTATSAPPAPAPPIVEAAPPIEADAENEELENEETAPADDGVDRWGWSETLVDLYALMKSKDWGTKWVKLREDMVTFEYEELFDSGRLLPTQLGVDRPHELGQWMKEHRPRGDYRVGQKDGEQGFGRRLKAWWAVMHPYRYVEKPEDHPEGALWPPRDNKSYEGEELLWSRLRVAGPNGLMLVILALTWWGQEIVNGGAAEGLGGGEAALAQHVEWQDMFEEIAWAVPFLTEETPPEMRAEWNAEKAEDLAGGAAGAKGAGERAEIGVQKKKRGKAKTGAPSAPKAAKKTASKTAPAKEKATGRKRKRAEDDSTGAPARKTRSAGAAEQEDQPAPLPRPKPRPKYKGRKGAESEGRNAEPEVEKSGAAGGAEVGGSAESTDKSGPAAEPASTSTSTQDVEMEAPGGAGQPSVPRSIHTSNTASNAAEVDEDPFADDPMAGFTEEERAAMAEEMVLDPDAEDEEEEE